MMQERLKQQARIVAAEAGHRLQREVANTVREAAEELGRRADGFLDSLIGELRSDLRGKLRGRNESNADSDGQ
ncbi:MAG TPA: hypothetical protein PLD20_05830 [Blastocatellia bacterium]|nr:hypothetical protein [Blastocatellia bacterium]HMV87606.1 hypothetical protein [Blastocatellia bacterium]HMX24712.1 hypothetical protein [Blastocatellia bacterium]HMY73353.1 hypothetical protein [Blastocatellia bacterium]HMZ17427.1 hypothetical protein [Blastocatellia bacterium]